MEMKLTTKQNGSHIFLKKTFKAARYIDGLYMVYVYIRMKITYNRPIYLGTSVLDL